MPCRAVPCRPSVAGCPGARRGVPVDLDVTKGRAHCGGAVISRGQRSEAIIPRSLEQRTAGSRRQSNSSGNIAARAATTMHMQGQANCPLNERCQIQANSTGGTATASASVAFAAERKQNASQRSDRLNFIR